MWLNGEGSLATDLAAAGQMMVVKYVTRLGERRKIGTRLSFGDDYLHG